ncbi:MAG: histidine phosphatase family protein [Nitrososphaeraceae archaeon]|jgi:phosphohistidine phosphatase SixA
MDLYLIRHGQSSSGKSLGRTLDPNVDANEKTLTPAGIAEIERTSKALKTLNIIPDAIVTSPLGYARLSAEIVHSLLFASRRGTDRKLKKKKKLKNAQVWNDLAPEGDRALVYKNLAKFKYESKIFVVGHEPFLTKMAADIVSSSSPPNTRRRSTADSPNLGYNRGNHRSIVIKKSGLARISITSMNPKLKGELRWLLTPMLLNEISLIKTRKKKREKKNQEIFPYPPTISSSNSTTTSKTKSGVTAICQ